MRRQFTLLQKQLRAKKCGLKCDFRRFPVSCVFKYKQAFRDSERCFEWKNVVGSFFKKSLQSHVISRLQLVHKLRTSRWSEKISFLNFWFKCNFWLNSARPFLISMHNLQNYENAISFVNCRCFCDHIVTIWQNRNNCSSCRTLICFAHFI